MPGNFPPLTKEYSCDLAEVLLLIGRLTTPVLGSSASLAEFWAYVRYLFAWSSEDWMTLTPEFCELDAHQKTILSDDIGMGLSIHWLLKKLGIIGICDGKYFIEQHLTSLGGTYTGKSAKRGPGKAPDFICLDKHGKFHVIECKGTQTSTAYRDKQLGVRNLPFQTDGIAQKNTVNFPTAFAGEKLACGVFIASDADRRTHLKVVDPEDPPILQLSREGALDSIEPMIRFTLSQMLRSSGFPMAARVAAFPKGRAKFGLNDEYVFPESDELDALREGAFEEFKERPTSERVLSDFGEFWGRSSEIELPRPLIINDRKIQKVAISQGINAGLIQDGAQTYFEQKEVRRKDDLGILKRTKFEARGDSVTMNVGKAYRSEITLIG